MKSNDIIAIVFISLAAIIAIIGSGIFSSTLGDIQPFCRFYPTFGSSLNTTTTKIDPQSYSGKWYEVARKPFSFESKCGCPIVNYAIHANNKTADVTNECLTPDGDQMKTTVVANLLEKNNSIIGISFELSIFTGKYLILDVDEEYKYALLGDPCRSYLWIMSRSSKVDKPTINNLLEKAKTLGYDTSDILYRENFCQG